MKILIFVALIISTTAFGYTPGQEKYLALDRLAVLQSPHVRGLGASEQVAIQFEGFDNKGDSTFKIQTSSQVLEVKVLHGRTPSGTIFRSVVFISPTTGSSPNRPAGGCQHMCTNPRTGEPYCCDIFFP